MDTDTTRFAVPALVARAGSASFDGFLGLHGREWITAS